MKDTKVPGKMIPKMALENGRGNLGKSIRDHLKMESEMGKGT